MNKSFCKCHEYVILSPPKNRVYHHSVCVGINADRFCLWLASCGCGPFCSGLMVLTLYNEQKEPHIVSAHIYGVAVRADAHICTCNLTGSVLMCSPVLPEHDRAACFNTLVMCFLLSRGG